MQNDANNQLLYNPMPERDFKVPPIKERPESQTASHTESESRPKEDVSDLLSNLAF
jgi:hypothetical protein